MVVLVASRRPGLVPRPDADLHAGGFASKLSGQNKQRQETFNGSAGLALWDPRTGQTFAPLRGIQHKEGRTPPQSSFCAIVGIFDPGHEVNGVEFAG